MKYAQEIAGVLNKIEQDVVSTKFSKVSKDKTDYANTLIGVANDCVQKSQYDQALEKIEQARQVIAELSEVHFFVLFFCFCFFSVSYIFYFQEPFNKLPVVVNFVASATERTTKLEQQVNESKFNKEAKNKMDYVATLKSSASSFLFRELWDQANTKLEEARAVLNELSQVFMLIFALPFIVCFLLIFIFFI